MEKWPIFEENQGFTPLEKCQFLDFFNFLFLLPINAFFGSRISKNTSYLPLLSKKNKLKKWPISEQNHGLTPLEKCQFFDFFLTSCFYCLEMRFIVLEYHKTHFPSLYFLKKKGKRANFLTIPWVNPFGKMSIFRLFELIGFIA